MNIKNMLVFVTCDHKMTSLFVYWKKGILIFGQTSSIEAIVIFVTTTHVHFLDDLVKNGPFKNADTEVSKEIKVQILL